MLIGFTLSLMGAFLMSGFYVAGAIGLVSLLLLHFFAPNDAPLWNFLPSAATQIYSAWSWIAIPLFILMGELVLRSGLAERMYSALSRWVALLPGGLLHTNIASCAIFAASSGSTIATAATISRTALPSFRARGYNERMVLGSLAAGGTLGVLIPPSILLLAYALIVDESIGRLFLAGFVPGLLMAGVFMIMIGVAAKIWPGMAPRETGGGLRDFDAWRGRFAAIIQMTPVLALVAMVLGTIYAGVFLPSEAGACGATGAFILAVMNNSFPTARSALISAIHGSKASLFFPVALRTKIEGMHRETPFRFAQAKEAANINMKMLNDAFLSTVRTTTMILLILYTALILQFALARLGISHDVAQLVIGLDLDAVQLVLVLILFYLVLGTFMESYSMLFLTLPLLLPALKGAGVDMVWFGIIVVILFELAQITPPQGLALYILQAARQEADTELSAAEGSAPTTGTIADVYIGVIPFIACMGLVLGFIVAFPEIVTWLPDLVKNRS